MNIYKKEMKKNTSIDPSVRLTKLPIYGIKHQLIAELVFYKYLSNIDMFTKNKKSP
jgi:hypothetical protein